ncbi:MAG TPA: GMC family oxidoreductase [Longimicrobiales bacterium]
MLTRSQQQILDAACRRIAPAADAIGRNKTLGDAVAARIATLTPFNRRRTLQALNVLGSPGLALMLVGRPIGFARLSPELQDRLLLRCEQSRLPLLRLLFLAIKRLVVNTWYGLPEARAEIDHRGPLPSREPEFAWEGPLPDAQPVVAAEPRPRTHALAVPQGVFSAADVASDLTINTEFCIIGSGVGGSVAACTLSEAGHDVVILETGPYRTAADFATSEPEALHQLYAEGGMRSTDDLSVSMLQGQCAGGGSTVNWMVMLRTPDYVLDEWQRVHGVEDMSAQQLQGVFERFEAETGVSPVPEQAHSRVNRMLLEGAHALGWQVESAKVNARDCMRAGLCGFGCPYDAKQSTLKNYLPRALSAGARLYCDTRADRIVDSTAHKTVWARTSKGRRVIVQAQRVIVAAGAVESPALLQRSGLGNSNVGRHLRLHPTTAVVGLYDHPVYAGAGIPLTSYCSEFMQLRGNYGHWIETPPFPAGLAAIALPGFGAQHRQRMAQYPQLAPFIVLVRDGSPDDPSQGSVQWQRSGRVRIRYRLSANDRAVMVHGLESAARIHFAQGARSVFGLHRVAETLSSEAEVPKLRALNATVGDPTLFSAHLNGTCRIGGNERDGACDPTGALYGTRGIYVLDGSLLPTAPGVNPHETIAAVVAVLSNRLV